MPSPSKTFLFDVMSTLVYDPIHREIPAFFDLELQELYDRNHPTAWVDFERGQISEDEFYRLYLPDDPDPIDGDALRETLHEAYRFLPGIPELLDAITDRHGPGHALSNYPVWSQIIEQRLQLSRWISWDFVSWKTGHRKPSPEAYQLVLHTLECPPEQLIFVDDRQSNCHAARQLGIDAIRFQDADHLRRQLRERRLL